MKLSKLTKTIILLVLCIGLFLLGLWVGRGKVVTKTEVIEKYIELPPIHDTVTVSKPIKVYAPVDTSKIIEKCVKDGIYSELFPEKIIEKEIYFTSEDTLAIVADWASKRIYEETIFDIDTLGSCVIVAEVQYNRLGQLEYTYKPIRKETIIKEYIEKKYEPFVGLSVFTDNQTEFEAGSFFKGHYGISVVYRRDLTEKKGAFGMGLTYKF